MNYDNENYSRRVAYYKKIAGIRERQDNGTLTSADNWFCAKEMERAKIGYSLILWTYLERTL